MEFDIVILFVSRGMPIKRTKIFPKKIMIVEKI